MIYRLVAYSNIKEYMSSDGLLVDEIKDDELLAMKRAKYLTTQIGIFGVDVYKGDSLFYSVGFGDLERVYFGEGISKRVLGYSKNIVTVAEEENLFRNGDFIIEVEEADKLRLLNFYGEDGRYTHGALMPGTLRDKFAYLLDLVMKEVGGNRIAFLSIYRGVYGMPNAAFIPEENALGIYIGVE